MPLFEVQIERTVLDTYHVMADTSEEAVEMASSGSNECDYMGESSFVPPEEIVVSVEEIEYEDIEDVEEYPIDFEVEDDFDPLDTFNDIAQVEDDD